MNWLFVVIGSGVVSLITWIMFGSVANNQPGAVEPPLEFSLLPITMDKEISDSIKEGFLQLLHFYDESSVDAIKQCEQLRGFNSAVIELNYAKLLLDRGLMTDLDNIRAVLSKASELLQAEPSRYDSAVNRFLLFLEEHVNLLESRE